MKSGFYGGYLISIVQFGWVKTANLLVLVQMRRRDVYLTPVPIREVTSLFLLFATLDKHISLVLKALAVVVLYQKKELRLGPCQQLRQR